MDEKKSQSSTNKQKFYSVFFGTCFETLFLFPFDTIKSRIQFSKEKKTIRKVTLTLFQENGIRSLYKGFGPFSVQLLTKYFIRLYSFDYSNQYLIQHFPLWKPEKRIFLSGIFSGLLETFFVVTPLEVIKTRLQIHHGKLLKFFPCIQNIYKHESIFAFWKGNIPTLIRQCSNQSLTFLGVYLMNNYIWKQKSNVPLFQSFCSGFCASAIALAFNNPCDVIKTRLMASSQHLSIRHCFLSILKEEGIKSFWKGYRLRMIRTSGGQAILFSCIHFFSPTLLK